MPYRWNLTEDGDRACGGIYLGDARLIAGAQPNELKIASIIAGAPQFNPDDIEEQLYLSSEGGLRGCMGDDELN
ncbi:MAG TPA: hypothetical protein VGT78_10505 [Rhizomicrobium sp.]|nr:hypothetical protein [Rhizomicrobium sp.]